MWLTHFANSQINASQFWIVFKDQLISIAVYGLLTSHKKRRDEFVLFTFLLFTANKSNLSVRFLGESTAFQSAFWFYLTFSAALFWLVICFWSEWKLCYFESLQLMEYWIWMQCQDVRIPVRTEITKRSVVYVVPLGQFLQSFIQTEQAMCQASEFFLY